MLKFLFLVKVISYFDIFMYLIIKLVYVVVGYYTSKSILVFYIYIKIYISMFLLTHIITILLSNGVFYKNIKMCNINYMYSNNNNFYFYNLLINVDNSNINSIYLYAIIFFISFCAPIFNLDGVKNIFVTSYIPENGWLDGMPELYDD